MSERRTHRRSAGLAHGGAPKSLFRRVEKTLDAIEHGGTILETISNVAEHMTMNFRDDLGIMGGRIYRLYGNSYELVLAFGAASPSSLGATVPRGYVAIEAVRESGLVVMDRDNPELDPALESNLGTRERFAAIAVADGDYLLSFDLLPGRGSTKDLRASLNIIRLAINQKLRQERFEAIMEDARLIQYSILPKRTPPFPEFDVAGDSRPAEAVGGDFFDYIPIGPETFGIAIADASGHGLPAALQVRDVYVGLRMGLTRDYKISRTVERLNSIINLSQLVSKFVSLFVAELETNGNMLYVNAGHVPPFLIHQDGTMEYLREGGMVLGPFPDATYSRGFASLLPGDILVFYTDGITECPHHLTDEEFSLERLQQFVLRNRHRSAEEIVKGVFRAVSRFSGTADPQDDQTMVVIKRRIPEEPSA